jgi:hypothetical protein
MVLQLAAKDIGQLTDIEPAPDEPLCSSDVRPQAHQGARGHHRAGRRGRLTRYKHHGSFGITPLILIRAPGT